MSGGCDEGLLGGTDIRASWIKNSGGRLVPVQYTNVNNIAVFEGCIILGRTRDLDRMRDVVAENPVLLDDASRAQTLGVAIKGAGYRWKNREIPYVIDNTLAAPARTQIVLDAIEHWHRHTPIRLKKRQSGDDSWVRFIDGGGCASAVGRQGGEQHIILGAGCSVGNAIHEIGHAVGLWHEQSRIDRDRFIEIVWSNIRPEARHNFSQHIEDAVVLGNYDLESIMHYGSRFFPIDPTQDTIKVKTPGTAIGQRQKLSAGDIAAVRELYP